MPVRIEERSAMISHRSEALATVVLTRLPEVTPARVDMGDIDFFAFLSDGPEEPEGFRFFAVIVKGSAAVGSVKAANALGRSLRDRLTGTVYVFPTIVLVCSMEDEKVYYAWQTEPHVDQGEPKLTKHRSLDFAEFTVEALRDTVNRVNQWYDFVTAEIAK